MTYASSARPYSGTSPNSAITPSFSPSDLSIRDILERWVGTDETLRAALVAHSSISHRRAEEERSRQEYYRLEARRVQYELLRESLRGGIHPSLIPQLFTQEKGTGPQNLSPISPNPRGEEGRPVYPTSSLPGGYNRPNLPRIDTSNLPLPPHANRVAHFIPSQRQKFAGPISAPPASMATTSPPPSIFFRHWAPPASRPSDERMQRPEDDPEGPRYHQSDHLSSPNSNRRSPPMHNGISPRRGSQSQSSTVHGRQRLEAPLTTKMHESRHHPYAPARSLPNRRHESEEGGLGATKSGLDRETVMRALREKVGPRSDDATISTSKEEDKAEKKEAERRKVEQARAVMALEQLVEPNGTGKE
jgi:hypothetical protein